LHIMLKRPAQQPPKSKEGRAKSRWVNAIIPSPTAIILSSWAWATTKHGASLRIVPIPFSQASTNEAKGIISLRGESVFDISLIHSIEASAISLVLSGSLKTIHFTGCPLPADGAYLTISKSFSNTSFSTVFSL